ncbi:hypothetical protein K435DRAFT_840974 [Dendrothele bispora CBS 962.96]|uniref:Uncharacterized protein n=1 Tax=Dendrothele bispora (strain CBS 962.96) TaxID=1314807 RepID=A0A4S8LQ87_DENBC|nr:hypothetical protein K435DRAFT_840974 [Dendrothele bispora CBS 962.96]
MFALGFYQSVQTLQAHRSDSQTSQTRSAFRESTHDCDRDRVHDHGHTPMDENGSAVWKYHEDMI